MKFIYTVLVSVLLFLSVVCSENALAESEIDCGKILLQIDSLVVSKNNISSNLNVAPYIKNGFTMLPVRFVSESLNAKVTWDDKTKEVTITKDNKILKLKLNDNKAYANGELKLLDVAAELKNGNTMIPLRFVSENLDSMVTWNKEDKSISIESEACVNEEDNLKITELFKKNIETRNKGDIESFMSTINSYDDDIKSRYQLSIELTYRRVVNEFISVNSKIKGDIADSIVTTIIHVYTDEKKDTLRAKQRLIQKIQVLKDASGEWKIGTGTVVSNETITD